MGVERGGRTCEKLRRRGAAKACCVAACCLAAACVPLGAELRRALLETPRAAESAQLAEAAQLVARGAIDGGAGAGVPLPAEPYVKRPFLMLSNQRSGSTWAMALLEKVPCVQGRGEIMLPVSNWGRQELGLPKLEDEHHALAPIRLQMLHAFFGDEREACEVADAPPPGNMTCFRNTTCHVAFSEEVWAAPAALQEAARVHAMRHHCEAARQQRLVSQGAPAATLGFKWMFDQGAMETLGSDHNTGWRWLADRGGRVVHLSRRDLIAREVSNMAMRSAREAGIENNAHAGDQEAASKLGAVFTMNVKRLVKNLKRKLEEKEVARNELARVSREFGIEVLHVYYEDLVGEAGEAVVCAMRAFVSNGGSGCGLMRALPTDTYFTKIHKNEASSYVNNWAECEVAVRKAGLEALLDQKIAQHDEATAAAVLRQVGAIECN